VNLHVSKIVSGMSAPGPFIEPIFFLYQTNTALNIEMIIMCIGWN